MYQRIIPVAIILILCAFTTANAWTPPAPPQAKVLAVLFYADWCPNCKILDPKIAEARETGALDKKNVLFVTMNFTDKTTIHQSLLLARALGIDDYVRAQGSGTGYLVLLDAGTKQEVGRFDRESSTADILKAIDERL